MRRGLERSRASALNRSSSSRRRSRRVHGSTAATSAAVLRPVAHGGQRGVQPVAVMGEQLVDPLVHPHPDRAVRGQHRRIRRLRTSSQRGHEVGQRARRGRLEADRGRDARQHVVAGEQQVRRARRRTPGGRGCGRGWPPRATGGRRRRPRSSMSRTVGDPLVRGLPARPVVGAAGARRRAGGSAPSAPARRNRRQVVPLDPVVGVVDHLRRLPLAPAERDRDAELAAQRHRLGVVVAVHVGDEEARTSPSPPPSSRSAADEQILGLRERPSRVDQVQPSPSAIA